MRNVLITLIAMMALSGAVYASDDIIDDGHAVSGIVVENLDCNEFGDNAICSPSEIHVNEADDADLDE